MIFSLTSLLMLLIGFIFGFLIRYIYSKLKYDSIDMKSKRLFVDIESQNLSLEKEKKLFEEKKTKDLEYIELEKKNLEDSKATFSQTQNNLVRLETSLESKSQKLEQREKEISSLEESVETEKQELEKERTEIREKLEQISQLSKEEAQDLLLKQLEKELDKEMALLITQKEDEARDKADNMARNIILNTISRLATEMTVESVVSSVNLPNDEMKGRIIGREGRNIRALETKTGVDIIIDDTPEAIILSCFDPIRREAARLTIERLIVDGRIQPARIEEIHNKVMNEIYEIIRQEGENACFNLGIHNIHPEMKKYIGRMKYRSSYGQNLLAHSVEVAHLASMMAGDLGLNRELAKRGGLLHDIGKIIMDDDRGHVMAGADLAKRFGESEEVINCILAHHEEVPHSTPESMIVRLADAISASRPGARRDSFERYIERLENLENIALEFKKIEKAYAIQAGRELRVIVNSHNTTDSEAKILARQIADKIESNLRYPGQIRVTIFRETRFVEYAK
jgi:ribonuclease Y